MRVLLAAAVALLTSSAALADPILPSSPGLLQPPSSAPFNSSAAGVITGTCGTTNAIAYFSAAQVLTCNATFLTDGNGRISTADGTTALPAYSFTSDTTMGMFKDVDPNFPSLEATIITGGDQQDVIIGAPLVFGSGVPTDFITIVGATIENQSDLIANAAQLTTDAAAQEEWCNTNFTGCGITIVNADGTDSGAKKLGIGTATPVGYLDITPVATLPSGTGKAFNVLATISNANASQSAIEKDFTVQAPVAGNPIVIGDEIFMHGVSNGTGGVWGGSFDNRVPGTGLSLFGTATAFNVGARATTQSATVGTNVGFAGYGSQSTGLNIGVFGDANVAVNTGGTRVGVWGNGSDPNGIEVGGYFSVIAENGAVPTLTAAALIANNSGTNDAIFIAQDNGTATFTIGDNGALTSTGATWTISNDLAVTLSGGVNGINFDSNTLSIDATNHRVGFFTAAPAAKIDEVAGTLASLQNALSITATLANPGANTQTAAMFTFGTSGGANSQQLGLYVDMTAGFTGARNTFGFIAENSAAGTTADVSGFNGNFGAELLGDAAGAGASVGAIGVGELSTVLNVGLSGSGQVASNNAMNIGVQGLARNTGTGTLEVGGYFVLEALSANIEPTTSAALIANNGTTTQPIFRTQDNGTDTFTIADGGGWTSTQATWTVSNDMDVTLSGGVNGWSFDGTTFSVDATNNRIGILTAAPAGALDVGNGFTVFSGTGFVSLNVSHHQTAACAAGTLALTPTASIIDIDANGAACVVTLSETGAQLGSIIIMNIVTSAGAGVVTFPDVTNVHNGPTLCTTTGITKDSTYTIEYVDEADDLYVGQSCILN